MEGDDITGWDVKNGDGFRGGGKGSTQPVREQTLCRPNTVPDIVVLTRYSTDLASLSACTQLRTLSIHLLGDFKQNDPNWAVLNTITSPYLEEIKICSFDGYVTRRALKRWEEIDDMLCQNYDRSHRNGVSELLCQFASDGHRFGG